MNDNVYIIKSTCFAIKQIRVYLSDKEDVESVFYIELKNKPHFFTYFIRYFSFKVCIYCT